MYVRIEAVPKRCCAVSDALDAVARFGHAHECPWRLLPSPGADDSNSPEVSMACALETSSVVRAEQASLRLRCVVMLHWLTFISRVVHQLTNPTGLVSKSGLER